MDYSKMTVLLVTNIISPHQMPLANCLAALVGPANFRYVATEPPMEDRVTMGWDCHGNNPWVLQPSVKQSDKLEFEKWWNNADVVLCGQRLIEEMTCRVRNRKLTFYMSERWWKPPLGIARLLHPRFALMTLKFRLLAKSSYFHYLPMGYYAEYDMRRIVPRNLDMWLWGYFTELPASQFEITERSATLKILYAGRMLPWKQVATLIRGFALLVNKHGKTAELTLIGDGPTRGALQELTKQLGIYESVGFYSSVPMSEVWQRMESSDVYVLPSNGYEGWGAVVNEAMSRGCALIASDMVGSAKRIINHGENGLLFPSGNWHKLGQILCTLYENEPMRVRLAEAGQKTIWKSWSPGIAAERLLSVSRSLLKGESVPRYEEGPMVNLSSER
jgi:glycosyltransferase involved in cell wall biosynthesis